MELTPAQEQAFKNSMRAVAAETLSARLSEELGYPVFVPIEAIELTRRDTIAGAPTYDEGDEEGVTGTSAALHAIAEQHGGELEAWNVVRLPPPGDGELNPAPQHCGRTARKLPA